jgi:hypothetical protein
VLILDAGHSVWSPRPAFNSENTMKRSLFFWIVAILALAFGGLMFLSPSLAAQAFGLQESAGTAVVFRILGATLLALALMNFLVRNHPASETLKAVLWTNVAVHGLGAVADLWSAAAGSIAFSGIGAGLVVHLFVGVGSLIYIARMENP